MLHHLPSKFTGETPVVCLHV